jgi:hypothetical protein
VRSRRRPVKRPASAERVAGLTRMEGRAGGSRRSRNGAAVPSAMPRAARRVDRTARRFGGTCGASRVGDTAESSSCAPSRASARTMRGEAGGPGTPVRTKHEGEKMLRAKARPREPFHAAWWSGPRLSGSTRGRTMCGRGPTPEDAAQRCAPPGKPAGRQGHQRYAGWTAPGEDNAPGRPVGSPKRAGSA